jgi:hypothetical protein
VNPLARVRTSVNDTVHAPRLQKVIGTVAVGVFLIANLVNTLNKAGDFDAYYAAGRRVLANETLYAGSAIAFGFIGPPVQALMFAPFALLDPQTSRLAWFIVNTALLVYALATWLGLFAPGKNGEARDATGPGWRRGLSLFTSPPAVLSILAVAFPLQTQFEHQNLNIVLLALAAFATDALMRHRAVGGGVALGIASALKIYPVVALVWLGLRREWRAFGAGVAAAAALTLAPVLVRGPHAFVADLSDWQALAASGWPTRRANQSLVAMWGRYLLGEGPNGFPTLTLDQPLVLWLAAATALVVIIPLVIALWRLKSLSLQLVEELICVSGLAILLSPIAWEHYWVGFFPLFLTLALYGWASDLSWRTTWQSRWARVSFVIGLVCVTVLSRPIVGWHGARAVRAWSLMTWAGLVMCAAFATILASRRWTPRLSASVIAAGSSPQIPQGHDRHGRGA